VTPARTIIACVPTDANAHLASWGSTERYSPGIDYTLTTCETCGTDMWMGPKLKAAYDEAPHLFVRLCATCAIKASPGAAVLQVGAKDSPRRIS
jgi:hypothetical protein